MSNDDKDQDRPSIKVTDRRMFDSEGNLRTEAERGTPRDADGPDTESPAPDAAASDPAPTAETDPAPTATSDAAPAAESEAAATVAEPEPTAAGAADTEPAASRPTAETAPPVAAPVAGEPAMPEPPMAPEPPAASEPPSAAPSEPAPEPEVPGAERGGPSDLPRDFAGFIESQYFETLLYLGAMPHPATGQVMEDLGMANYKIDLLTMLQEKTEGNRSPEESKILEDVLYQLRMAYLQKSKVVKL